METPFPLEPEELPLRMRSRDPGGFPFGEETAGCSMSAGSPGVGAQAVRLRWHLLVVEGEVGGPFVGWPRLANWRRTGPEGLPARDASGPDDDGPPPGALPMPQRRQQERRTNQPRGCQAR